MKNGSGAVAVGARQFGLSTPFWMRVAWLSTGANPPVANDRDGQST